jgi:hemolysin activation/secretion protein
MASILKVDELRGIVSAGDITVTSEGGAATQSLQQGLVKAWVNFNGTGTIAIRDSLSVSGLVDNNTGNYTVNYSSSMGNDDYSSTVSANASSGLFGTLQSEASMTTTATNISCYNGSINPADHAVVCLHTLGDLA